MTPQAPRPQESIPVGLWRIAKIVVPVAIFLYLVIWFITGEMPR
jgi:type IV secretory pathway protease TraF